MYCFTGRSLKIAQIVNKSWGVLTLQGKQQKSLPVNIGIDITSQTIFSFILPRFFMEHTSGVKFTTLSQENFLPKSHN